MRQQWREHEIAPPCARVHRIVREGGRHVGTRPIEKCRIADVDHAVAQHRLAVGLQFEREAVAEDLHGGDADVVERPSGDTDRALHTSRVLHGRVHLAERRNCRPCAEAPEGGGAVFSVGGAIHAEGAHVPVVRSIEVQGYQPHGRAGAR